MNIGDRISKVRKSMNLSQDEFGKKINVTRSAISNYEKGTRNIMDRVVADICREFNVSEKWLREGIGEMFVEADTFSLDEYLKSKGATDLELKIMKCYFDIPKDIRKTIVDTFKSEILPNLSDEDNEITATTTDEDYKIKELKAYSIELDAESKGKTSSVSENSKDIRKINFA